MAKKSLGKLFYEAEILQRAAKISGNYRDLNDTIVLILQEYLDKVQLRLDPKQPQVWRYYYAVLQVVYGGTVLTIPVPKLEILDEELAQKVKDQMSEKMFLKNKLLSYYSTNMLADIEVESSDSTVGLAHFHGGGSHPVVFKEAITGSGRPDWWLVVRLAPGTIVGMKWDSASQKWEDGRGYDAPEQGFFPVPSNLKWSARDSMTASLLRTEGETDEEWHARLRPHVENCVQRLTAMCAKEGMDFPVDEVIIEEAIANCMRW